jgi:hypothetical protein
LQRFLSQREKAVIAHGVLASLAFVLSLPFGSILIRVVSFPGVWLVHGLFQIFAAIIYVAAFGIGIWLASNAPIPLLGSYHGVIGIVVFCILVVQPFLG